MDSQLIEYQLEQIRTRLDRLDERQEALTKVCDNVTRDHDKMNAGVRAVLYVGGAVAATLAFWDKIMAFFRTFG